ncbi:hypothetical protein C2G38_231495 [Gigaspora rosea]|uniref:Uncharacterized protein n=1 Tax=Gigaspora rosea TaxID=44941 RepID=A0A397UL09_9GLOM|nr:hypothetical protein C2G38_231495 [Gigaspora rosea]
MLSGEDMTFEQVHTSFYQALARTEALSKKKPEIIKKIKQLRGTKEGDIKRVGNIFKPRNDPKYIVDTLSNTSGGQETDAALPAPSKKRKANDAVSVASSARLQELPHSISRSEVYKSVNFETATTKELLINPQHYKPLCELHNYFVFREFEEFEELGGYHE